MTKATHLNGARARVYFQEYLFWNACTGEHHSHRDSLCPVISVGSLINKDNVWFNMQQFPNPSRMNFNVSDLVVLVSSFSLFFKFF